MRSHKRRQGFPDPAQIGHLQNGHGQKRVVYTYPQDENTVLKLLTWMILRKYDRIFSSNLYSFRPARTAKDAVRDLLKTGKTIQAYSYKVDIHDYFNSVPVERLLPMLKAVLEDDEKLYLFLAKLLLEPRVSDRGEEVIERKGIMAGTPLSSFFANLYLSELDRHFEGSGEIYARYSDDMIVFAPNEAEVKEQAEFIRSFLSDSSLTVNPAKESFASPRDGFVFLGFSCLGNKVDIAPATVKKLKQKMRRKCRALTRWQKRNGFGGEKAAKAFVRIFNAKLLESPSDNELSWSHWFFPVISTTESLHAIDLYAQDCLRYLMSGKHTKARYNIRYADLKAIGYRSLVHAYYEYGGECVRTEKKADPCP